jgi:hypothetical protein
MCNFDVRLIFGIPITRYTRVQNDIVVRMRFVCVENRRPIPLGLRCSDPPPLPPPGVVVRRGGRIHCDPLLTNPPPPRDALHRVVFPDAVVAAAVCCCVFFFILFSALRTAVIARLPMHHASPVHVIAACWARVRARVCGRTAQHTFDGGGGGAGFLGGRFGAGGGGSEGRDGPAERGEMRPNRCAHDRRRRTLVRKALGEKRRRVSVCCAFVRRRKQFAAFDRRNATTESALWCYGGGGREREQCGRTGPRALCEESRNEIVAEKWLSIVIIVDQK